MKEGAEGIAKRAIQVAAIAPIISCPSAPIFERLALKARTRPIPQRSKGIDLDITCAKPLKEPKEPMKMALYAIKGSTP